jgi:hypothetical protein
MQLTPEQQKTFWAIWRKCDAELDPQTTAEQRTEYRRAQIVAACGKSSLRLVNRSTDFDQLMAHCAALCGDYEEAARWAGSAEHRMAWMVAMQARQIAEIAGVPHGWEYCRKIFAQMRLPEHYEDMTGGMLMSAFQALDTHRRRVLRRDHGWGMRGSGRPLGFSPNRRYFTEPGKRTICWADDYKFTPKGA